MVPTHARLTRLLALLEGQRDWRGADLAAQLGVTRRTVRNDIERLRRLGYGIESFAGAIGGYRLIPGGRLPPLVLDGDEAAAVTVALRNAAGRDGPPASGLEEATLRVMLKVERLLGPTLLGRAETASRGARASGRKQAAMARKLRTLATACEQRQRVRFFYGKVGQAHKQKQVNPHRLISRDGCWQLVGWDSHAAEWIAFPVGQMRTVIAMAWEFRPQALSDSDLGDLLARSSPEDSRPG
jgi:predicted DNA-binding transcriptional regulator YafY